jgi:phosphoglycolate phosphatase
MAIEDLRNPQIPESSNSAVRLVVFDLDGTLVNSRRDLADSANTLLEQSGCRPQSEEAIGRMVGDGAATLVRRAFAAAHGSPPPDALERFLAIYNQRLLKFTHAYDGVVELLRDLRQRTVLAVLTNKPLPATRTILEGLGLAEFFGNRVLGGDGPLPRKPDPAGLVAVIASARVSAAETLLIGDSLVDWQTARAASAHVCLARYGFGFDGFPVDRLTTADWVIDHPMELIGRL